ncbi:MAG: hypothetical protein LUF30_11875 [Lachnospiraceae bacterium]|nr:hypothetical protein [Lachnospiraceae bacterium]
MMRRFPPTMSLQQDASVSELQVLLQPGMVYSHSIYLTEQLAAKRSWLKDTADEDRELFISRTDEFVRGEILEYVLLSETFLTLRRRNGFGNRYYVSQLGVHRGQREVLYSGGDAEADLLVMDWNKKETCLFEIKHSDKHVRNQSKNLRNEEFLVYVDENFYPVKHRAVIYRGSTGVDEDGTIYLNVEEYLKKVDVLRKEEQPEFAGTIFSEVELPFLTEEENMNG